jgi:hypothetical protein
LFFGWGGEDDELSSRVVYKYKKIEKIDPSIGRYYTIDHAQDKANPNRFVQFNLLLIEIKLL